MESGQWLEIVDQTYLALASGKLVPTKIITSDFSSFSAFLANTLNPHDKYKTDINSSYHADLQRVDFANAREAAETINLW